MKALTIKVKHTDIVMTRKFESGLETVYAIQDFLLDLMRIGVEYPDIEITINPVEEEK